MGKKERVGNVVGRTVSASGTKTIMVEENCADWDIAMCSVLGWNKLRGLKIKNCRDRRVIRASLAVTDAVADDYMVLCTSVAQT